MSCDQISCYRSSKLDDFVSLKEEFNPHINKITSVAKDTLEKLKEIIENADEIYFKVACISCAGGLSFQAISTFLYITLNNIWLISGIVSGSVIGGTSCIGLSHLNIFSLLEEYIENMEKFNVMLEDFHKHPKDIKIKGILNLYHEITSILYKIDAEHTYLQRPSNVALIKMLMACYKEKETDATRLWNQLLNADNADFDFFNKKFWRSLQIDCPPSANEYQSFSQTNDIVHIPNVMINLLIQAIKNNSHLPMIMFNPAIYNCGINDHDKNEISGYVEISD